MSSASLTDRIDADSMPDWISRLCQQFACDASLDEVLVNGARATAEVRGSVTTVAAPVGLDSAAMIMDIQDFAAACGLRLDPLQPAAGGVVSHTSAALRWHAVIPPIAKDGPFLSLRRHRFSDLTLDDFSMSLDLRERLIGLATSCSAILFAGATGVGKTSLMSAWLRHVALAQRVAIIERLEEIPALAPGWIRLVEQVPGLDGRGSFPISDLFREALRLRPERIVVGEIRGDEAQTFLQCALSGHGSVTATIHAGSPLQARARLLSCATETPGVAGREEAPRMSFDPTLETMAALDVQVVQVTRDALGRPSVSEIASIGAREEAVRR